MSRNQAKSLDRRSMPRHRAAALNLRRSDGLVLRVGTPELKQATAEKLAREIVQQELPGKWVVSPLGDKTRDFSVRRPPGVPNPSVPNAFDIAYRMRAHRDVEDCEPALIVPVDGPEEMRNERVAVTRTASLPGAAHLMCSTKPTWALDCCRIRQAWELTRPTGGHSRGVGIVIGHPDTGYTKHPLLAGNRLLIQKGYDFEDDDSDPLDLLNGISSGHGTSTGSVIISEEVGTRDPAKHVTGVAPKAKLVPLRVTTSVVLLSFRKLAESIRFAADNGHHVVSISLGGPIYSRFLHRAVESAVAQGVIILCAAGNVWPFVVYPARLVEVIAVAACNCRKEIWDGSASGAAVDVTAPGESVWHAQTELGNFSTDRGSGTSYSTAIVAGAAAMWLAHHGRDNLISRYGIGNLPSVFKEVLLSKGVDRPAGWDTSRFGAGVLNAVKLISAPIPRTAPAGGMRQLHASVVPRKQNDVDDIADLFPNEKPADIRLNLSRLFRVQEKQLLGVLHDVGEEVAFLATTDMRFRQTLKVKRRAQATSTAVRARALAGCAMSRRLRRMLAEGD